jgi:hypothetical protein
MSISTLFSPSRSLAERFTPRNVLCGSKHSRPAWISFGSSCRTQATRQRAFASRAAKSPFLQVATPFPTNEWSATRRDAGRQRALKRKTHAPSHCRRRRTFSGPHRCRRSAFAELGQPRHFFDGVVDLQRVKEIVQDDAIRIERRAGIKAFRLPARPETL